MKGLKKIFFKSGGEEEEEEEEEEEGGEGGEEGEPKNAVVELEDFDDGPCFLHTFSIRLYCNSCCFVRFHNRTF